MSQFFRKGGIALNDTEWIQDFADRRLQYGVSQTKLGVMAGISREHLSRIESGKVAVTEEMKVKLLEALEKFNPEAPLTMLFDYVRIRFPTLDIGHIIKDILQLNIKYMIHEDFGHYSYTEHYYIGDIFVYTSPDEEKGVLLELKGKGCRQFECVSVFRSFKSYASGELVKHEEQDKAGMGYTLYIGSLKSEVYFCVYEKSYEQYIKLGIPIEEAPIKNRFEIRLKNERAYYAVRDLLTYYDAERTAFSIINRYVRFVDKEADKKRSDWKLSVRWAWFIGENREPLKLTTKPEPYTLDRTLRWIQRQVDPTLKMLETITAKTGIDYLKEIRKSTKLTEKHYKIIEQQTTSTEDVILEKEN